MENLAFDEDLILNQLDDSDIEGFPEDDEDLDQNYEPPSEAVSDQSSDDEERTAPLPPSTQASKAKLHTWKKGKFPSKPDIVKSYVVTEQTVNSPAQYFEKYFTEEVFERFAFYTNQYFQQQNGVPMNVPCTPSEIKRFFGIHGLMGIFKYPQIRMYWSTRHPFKDIIESMPRNRFFLLRVNLHCVDNLSMTPEQQKSNRLWKVQPIIDAVRKRCLELERGSGTYSIDEQMIPFLGSCPVRQVVKNKPRPVGLKNYVITTSAGLMLDFEIQQGSTTPFPDTSLGHGPAVVLRLVQTLPPGSSVYFDRYFTTIPLLDKLTKIQIDGTGTLQTNRVSMKDPQYKKLDLSKGRQKVLKRGEFDEYIRDDQKLCLLMWKDSKAIVMGSTSTGSEPVATVKRWDKQSKTYIDVQCPAIVKKYNECMGGVDVLDQMMEYWRSWLRTKKWPLKVIIHFFDLAIVNSWFEYRLACELTNVKKKDQLQLMDFRLSIAEYLVGGPTRKRTSEHLENAEEPPMRHVNKISAPVAKPTQDKRYDGYNHWPCVDNLKNPHTCRLEGCKSRSRTRCTKCNVYLCLNKDADCFVKFHVSE